LLSLWPASSLAQEPAPPADPTAPVAGPPLEEAPPAERLESARNRFEFGDCAGAEALLRPIAQPGTLEDANQLVDAYRMLGVCAAQREDEAAARAWFRKLLYIDLEHRLDAFRTPPPVTDLFESIRRDIREEKKRLEEARENAEQDDPTSRFVVIERERVVTRTPLATIFLPFGVPQFGRDAPVAGTAMLATQAGSLALNIGAMVAFWSFDLADSKLDGQPGRDPAQEQAMLASSVVAWIGAVGFVASYGYGVADALWSYEEIREGPLDQSAREVDPELGERLLRRLGEE
jgi:hypothetical protein